MRFICIKKEQRPLVDRERIIIYAHQTVTLQRKAQFQGSVHMRIAVDDLNDACPYMIEFRVSNDLIFLFQYSMSSQADRPLVC